MSNSAGASRLKELIAVAKEGTGETRRDLLRDITNVFMATPDRYTSTEMQHFDVIMSRITAEVEIALRQELAEKLADVPSAPKGLIRQLAHDEISVAEPVLARSEALSEEDLVGVVRQRSQAHLRAIARRRKVPEKLTAELVERGDESVLLSLAENDGARFNELSMQKIVDHSRSSKGLQKSMTERVDLPAHLLTKMYFFVSSALKKEILKRSDLLDPSLIDAAVQQNRQKILDAAVETAREDVNKAHAFIEDKIAANAVNESLLKELISTRQKIPFLLAFSHYVGVDPSTAQSIMMDKSWESLAIACRANSLERTTFAKIVFGMQSDGDNQASALRILDIYLKIPHDAAERVMRFWCVRKQAIVTAAEREKRRATPAATPRRAVAV